MPKRDAAYMEERRNAIVDATIACLRRTGISGLSTSAICQEAGISMGALYRHFSAKSEIFQAVVERVVAKRRPYYNFTTPAEMKAGIMTMFGHWLEHRDDLRADLELTIAQSAGADLSTYWVPVKTSHDLVEPLGQLIAKGYLRRGAVAREVADSIEAMMLGISFSFVAGVLSKEAATRTLASFLDNL